MQLTAKLAAITLLSALILFAAPQKAAAGFEPSPFRAEIGAYRLNLVQGMTLTAQQMVAAVLGSPPDDNKSINATERIARQLNKLTKLVTLTSIDVIKLGCPPDDQLPTDRLGCPPDDMIPVINELSAIAATADLITNAIEAFFPSLGSPPDDIKPKLADALNTVLVSAKLLAETANDYIVELTCSDPTVTQ